MHLPLITSILFVASTAFALPNPDARFRPGANHHVGDDSFVERFGRTPTDADSEHERMTTHLEHVRAWLASRPATRPELAQRRAELLGYLDDYIARSITPRNTHLPWRTAVFIDDDGAICAVGYLIERSVGRALPEQIAAVHRYDFLEDIAAAMPEVDAWIQSSGFTLDELASIQPAYASPNVETWRTWDLVRHAPPDGPFDKRNVTGTFAHRSMQGAWTVKNDRGVVVGKGDLVRGSGTWRSYYPDGNLLLAEGPYVKNVAHGAWTFFHPSGNVAAEGGFSHGMRAGHWRFYNDTEDKKLIAAGEFASDGRVIGTWKHYDADGQLLARTYAQGQGDRIDVVPAADGVTHQMHQFLDSFNPPIEMYSQKLERFSHGAAQVYVHTTAYRDPTGNRDNPSPKASIIYDPEGFKLERSAGGWTAADCRWSKKRIAAAHAGDLAWLHDMLFHESAAKAVKYMRSDYDGGYKHFEGDPGPTCGKPEIVAASRGALLDTLLATRDLLRAQSPTFVRKLVLNQDDLDGEIESNDEPVVNRDEDDEAQLAARPKIKTEADLRRVLAAYTLGYVEWPHIDGRFERVFATMAGRIKWEWSYSEPEADDSDPLQNAQAEERRR